MNPVRASGITIVDDEITLDADLLAPKLGLSPCTSAVNSPGTAASSVTMNRLHVVTTEDF
jgi:hypothetical protein